MQKVCHLSRSSINTGELTNESIPNGENQHGDSATLSVKTSHNLFCSWQKWFIKKYCSGILYIASTFGIYPFLQNRKTLQHENVALYRNNLLNSLGIGCSFHEATASLAPALAILILQYKTQNWCIRSSMLMILDSSMLCRAILMG